MQIKVSDIPLHTQEQLRLKRLTLITMCWQECGAILLLVGMKNETADALKNSLAISYKTN